LGNATYGVKGTVQSKIEDIKEQIDGWKWLATTDPKAVAASAKIYFDDIAKQELAKAEENPGAYVFRKGRDITAALLPDLMGGKRTTKTTKVADELDDLKKVLGERPEVDAINHSNSFRMGLTRQPRHHVFPQEHRQFFEERGFTGDLDIDNFTVELPESAHQAIHGGGNWRLGRKWEGEWNNRVITDLQKIEMQIGRTLTRDEIFDEVQKLMKRYEIDGTFIPYKGGK
jgi:hypothetical protein